MKFQILTAALTPGLAAFISDDNVFAWQHSIYPFHDHQQEYWAEPFESYFEVNRQMIEELAKFLDDTWLKSETITFYELEKTLQAGVVSNWDRSKLIDACRYFFLRKMFDDNFWQALLQRGNAPNEASVVNQAYDRFAALYLG
jgi:hypothetical protein